MKVYFASGNAHKREELSAILETALVLPKEENIDFDPEETGSTFFENAFIKAKALWDIVQQPVIADDSGICVDALNGAPGIYSARYGSDSGKNLTAEDKNALLLKNTASATNRKCHFVCCMILMLAPDRFFTAQETLEGELMTESHGSGGFGYDPIVWLPTIQKTVAELTTTEKNKCSHRAKAGLAIKKFLQLAKKE